MTRRPCLAVVALAGAATMLAGCGAVTGLQTVQPESGTNNSSQPPAAELTSAVAALGNASTLTTAVTLGTTATVLGPILHSLGAKLTPNQVATLAGAQISLEVVAPHGKTINDVGSSGDAAQYAFELSSNGTTYLALRSLNQTLYVQADVKDLLTTIGEASKYAALERKVATLPGFVQALVAGKWVSLPDDTLSLLRSMGDGGLLNAPSASPSPAERPNILGALKTLLSRDVTVTRISAGSTDRLLLTANSRALTAGLLNSFAAAVPGAGRGRPKLSPSDVPSEKVTLTADVTHGALSELSINLGQYDKPKKIDVPLDVTFARSGPEISAPSGAVQADIVGLLGLMDLFGRQGNDLGSSFGTSLVA